ncbi:hypothetical protein RclHR1_22110001, partial [Rhizophagus clarus]
VPRPERNEKWPKIIINEQLLVFIKVFVFVAKFHARFLALLVLNWKTCTFRFSFLCDTSRESLCFHHSFVFLVGPLLFAVLYGKFPIFCSFSQEFRFPVLYCSSCKHDWFSESPWMNFSRVERHFGFESETLES